MTSSCPQGVTAEEAPGLGSDLGHRVALRPVPFGSCHLVQLPGRRALDGQIPCQEASGVRHLQGRRSVNGCLFSIGCVVGAGQKFSLVVLEKQFFFLIQGKEKTFLTSQHVSVATWSALRNLPLCVWLY